MLALVALLGGCLARFDPWCRASRVVYGDHMIPSVLAVATAAYVPTARVGTSSAVAPARTCAPLLQQTKASTPFSGFFQSLVPQDQQPVAELQNLRSQAFYDWADSDEGYSSKLQGLYVAIMLLLSLPISFTTYNQLPFELPQLLLAANLGTLGIMVPFVFRLRVGWAFVSRRLKQKATYYEAEQRGLLARKDRATQTRDRLIEKTEVRPNLRRIDVSFLALLFGLFLTVTAAEAITIIEGENGPSTLKAIQGDAAIDYTNRLRGDDEFAAREQARARRKADENGEGVKPVYCDSRYYKILAGGNGQGGVGCS